MSATRKDQHTLDQVVAETAARKARAAAARSEPRPAGAEAPRDVFLAATASICAALPGFKYAKSGPHATRKAGPFTHTLAFQSSFHNVAGEHVRLCVHATVKSPALRAFRRAHGGPDNDYAAGGQLGNLALPRRWIDWELADAARRDEALADIRAHIERLALPFFALFADLPALAQTLRSHGELPGMDVEAAVILLATFADQCGAGAAQACLRAFFAHRPELVPAFRAALAADRHGSGFAERAAFWAGALGLTL
jgi:hypothetical protein